MAWDPTVHAGIDWGNIENQDADVNLESTLIEGGGGIDWSDLTADHDDVVGSFGQVITGTYARTQAALPAFAPGTAGGLPTVDGSNYIAGIQGTINTLDDIEISPTVDVEVVGGGPVEHEPVADINKRTLSRRADGTTGLNRNWSQRASEIVWHSVNCAWRWLVAIR